VLGAILRGAFGAAGGVGKVVVVELRGTGETGKSLT
jgi:hypothetical protein